MGEFVISSNGNDYIPQERRDFPALQRFKINNRLTKTGAISGKDINELLDDNDKNQFGKTKAYYKLQHYEDLEDKKLLIELPCNLDDTVYTYSDNCKKVLPYTVTKIYFDFNNEGKPELFIEGKSIKNGVYLDSFELPLSAFNEQVFLTEEESKVIAPFNKEYPTYIIAYSPDTDAFFITNQRQFFYEYDKEFKNEKEAFAYFKNNFLEFIKIRNVCQQLMGQKLNKQIYIDLGAESGTRFISYSCMDKELTQMIPEINKEIDKIKQINEANKPDIADDIFDIQF